MDSPKWLKNKKATINPKNSNNNFFQYALTVALNYQSIKRDPQRISKTKPFIIRCNWTEIDIPSQKKDCRKFKSNNKSIAFNVLYILVILKKLGFHSNLNIILSVIIK